MSIRTIRWLACLALIPHFGSFATAQMRPEATGLAEVAATRDLLKSVRAGGYVLYMRHASTDTSKPDAVPQVDLNDCSTQRNLNDEGRKMAAAIGRHLREAAIPVGEVIYSPFCRTRETAKLAFEGQRTPLREERLLAYPSNMTAEEKKPVLEVTRRLLSTPVPRGTNRLLVGHSQNVAELMDFFIKPEGSIAIFRPQGAGQFVYVASIGPAAWPSLVE